MLSSMPSVPSADECERPGSCTWNFHAYISDLEDFEYWHRRGDVTAYVSAVGGGTVGEKHEGHWYYAVTRDGAVLDHGDDCHTGTPRTHAHVARMILDIIAEETS